MTQPTIQKLEPLAAPLQGINLIEASAGTGKTYTITTLFIRLILEQQLTVDQILVVTFTEAATEELRDRIRRRLHEALTAFEQEHSEDEVLTGLMTHCEHQSAIFRLTNALRGFDEAAIFTIHSFCRQMLQDNAFESGLLFDTELVSDQSHLLREIVEDFWRQYFYSSSQLFITYALENGYSTPKSLLNTLNYGQYVGQPFLNIIPKSQSALTEAKELAFYTAFSETQQTWQTQATEVEDLLLNDGNLNRNKYRKKSIPQWCKAVDTFLNAPVMSINLPDKFIKFTNHEIALGTKKGKLSPQHPFFEHSDKLLNSQKTLADSFEKHLLTLKIQLFDIAKQSLARKKHEHRIQSFDDLLINLYKALKGKNGENLARLIRNKFQAALIDEFQDTDPVQYEIFRRIYGSPLPSPPPEGTLSGTNSHSQILFLIGDPKQAIYSFRGADIFTYMTAYRDAQNRYTLATNWRSEADLIGGVNQLFMQTKHPFLFEDITFQPVQAPVPALPLDPSQGPENEQPRLKIENKLLPPLQLWFVPRHLSNCPGDKPINKGWAKQRIPYSISHEIARLLTLAQNGQALIDDKPLAAGDIAILVRTNAQAFSMQKVLTQLQIPSVLYSRESLFTSHEVMEIERVLQAIADIGNDALLKAALTTDILGLSGTELHHLMENDSAWQTYLNRFQNYHQLWEHKGFIQMYRSLLLEEQVQPHLLSYPDGERRLTNVLHAGEVLQQIAMQQKLGMTGLCQWLSLQRQQQSAAEEQQLRLESDEKLVKIVTIHKSKGLEYPIVFCPFVWDGYLYNSKSDQFIFHDEEEKMTLDLGSEEIEAHRARALEEERAENLRLFYVAVTRAKHRCYLVWGAFKDASTSTLAHLLHPGVNIEKTDDAILWQSLQSMATASNQQIQVSNLPTDKTPYTRPIEKRENLKPRYFKGKIDKTWKVSSFSSISYQLSVSSYQLDAERPDYDETASKFPLDHLPRPLGEGWGEGQPSRPLGEGWGEGPPPLGEGWGEGPPPLEEGWYEDQPPLEEGWYEGQPPLEEGWYEGLPPLEEGWSEGPPPLEEGWSEGPLPQGEGQPPRPLGEGRGEGQPPRPLGEGRGEGHQNILSFPRGARPGRFMHALFEYLDFTKPDDSLIANQLERFGYDSEQWQPVIKTMVDNVLNTSLDAKQPNLTLSQISRDKRLNELEFYYPLSRITPQGLQKVFVDFGHHSLAPIAEEASRLRFAPVQGFMKGFMDMVFEYQGRYYLVDYKSNFLGIQPEDYAEDHLTEVMTQQGYLLQYHIYAVALHRYLTARLPDYQYDNHFGGIYYLFLRGMNQQWGSRFGIYQDKPTAELIDKLSAYLCKS
jgi:exodeoxyribonuclease V beta subunit